MVSVILFGVPVAGWVAALWRAGDGHRAFRAVAAASIFVMVCTGIVDLITVANRNAWSRGIWLDDADPASRWIRETTRPDAVFLTHWNVLDPVLASGRSIFFGWPYYAWSAGYDEAPLNDRS